MDHYIDITISPDAKLRENVLLNMAYSKLHKALFDLESCAIGVSFPLFQVKLGNRIRLHGRQAALTQLQALNWLGDLASYCHVTDVQSVPNQVQYRVIFRIQSTMTQAKLNRLIKRGSIEPEKVSDYKAKMFRKGLDNPYLELESTSNGHKHRRYIAFGEFLVEPVHGVFDHFGLSKHATIPWF
jgi:CRISPR-associated endonuclease Csy4